MSDIPIRVLIADDDEATRMIIQRALEECSVKTLPNFVTNGEELRDYLLRKNEYQDAEKYPIPDVVFVDLNMPKLSGEEALRELKNARISFDWNTIVLTTSDAEKDLYALLELGVNSFLVKPDSFDELVQKLELVFHEYLQQMWGTE